MIPIFKGLEKKYWIKWLNENGFNIPNNKDLKMIDYKVNKVKVNLIETDKNGELTNLVIKGSKII